MSGNVSALSEVCKRSCKQFELKHRFEWFIPFLFNIKHKRKLINSKKNALTILVQFSPYDVMLSLIFSHPLTQKCIIQVIKILFANNWIKLIDMQLYVEINLSILVAYYKCTYFPLCARNNMHLVWEQQMNFMKYDWTYITLILHSY